MKKSRNNILLSGFLLLTMLGVPLTAMSADEPFYGLTPPSPPQTGQPVSKPFYPGAVPQPPADHGKTSEDVPEKPKGSENPLKKLVKTKGEKGKSDTVPAASPEGKSLPIMPLPPIKPVEEEKEDPAIMEKLKMHSEGKAIQIIYDEGFQPVEVSLRDITRVVCFSDITRTVYSKEKNIEIKTEGKDAFIKNLPAEAYDPATGRPTLKYDAKKKEVYILCGNHTFSLLLVPRDIPATTIYLKVAKEEKDKATKYEHASDYENTLMKLVGDVYKENIPDGYDITEVNKMAANLNEADIVHKRTYTGDTFQVLEYIFFAKQAATLDEIALLELLTVRNPLAITAVDVILEAKQQTRIFVVRLNNE